MRYIMFVGLIASCSARSSEPGEMVELGTSSGAGETSDLVASTTTEAGDAGDTSSSSGTDCDGACTEGTSTGSGSEATGSTSGIDESSTSGEVDSTSDSGAAACGDNVRVVFVTSTLFTGQLGGLVGADQACRARAAAAGLAQASTFRAWLSDNDGGPASRFDTEFGGCYRTTSGAVVAHGGFGGLTDVLVHAIDHDEHGAFALEGTITSVWSNTDHDGGSLGSQSCQNWATSAPGALGGIGEASFAKGDGDSWTMAGESTCQASLRLYCFEDLQ